MRYLNKIIFINSASVTYTEIELNGNVHLIGTQGVGKSTLLRAILFFYSANKSKLGIPKEKRGFDDYYFQYQNSYIVYEVVKNNIPFCVLAYKTSGKVAFRFFDSAYKSALFLDQNNRAYENWDKIRDNFGRNINYTSLVNSYEDYRRIIYGDNKGLKANFRKYAIVESKQYQNIPRTIQNVFLNSNLEAKFIKDTIIKSLNEEEFVIDIENYSKVHLRDFESQINDIKIWFKTNKKGQIVVRKQADSVVEKHRLYNFLNREKRELTYKLAYKIDCIENEKPSLISKETAEKLTLKELDKQRDNLSGTHKNREQKIISGIDHLKKELYKAKEKQEEYINKNITEIIKKVANKSTLLKENNALKDEKSLLTSKFTEVKGKYDALIDQVKNQQQEFTNIQNAQINTINSDFTTQKNKVTETYKALTDQIRTDNKDDIDKVNSNLKLIVDDEQKIKIKKSSLKHQTFFKEEIESCEKEKINLNKLISDAQINIKKDKNLTENTRKEWDLEKQSVENYHKIKIDKANENIQKLSDETTKIKHKITQSKSSLYGWLNDHYPNWENTIGKVIDEDVLFTNALNPRITNKENTTFFGVELNLNALKSRVKTVKDYEKEISDFSSQINGIQKNIQQLHQDKQHNLQKLKKKFGKKLNALNDAVSENEYIIQQTEQKLKKNTIELKEWIDKSKNQKAKLFQELEVNLEKLAFKKATTEQQLETINKGIKRKIKLKEKERNAKIENLENEKSNSINHLKTAISERKTDAEERIKNLKTKQLKELDTKGADTERLEIIDRRLSTISNDLKYIENNEWLVFEYKKDKRELFDKVPQLKIEKTRLEKKKNTIEESHKIEMQKMNAKYLQQEGVVKSIVEKLKQFDTDLDGFETFKKSEVYLSVQYYFSDEIKEFDNLETATSIIIELNNKHWKSIQSFKELQQATNVFTGNFNENNIFKFNVKLNTDSDYLNFSSDLKEFIEEDKINEFEKRVNERFASIIRLIGRETTELNSKEAEIEKVIKKINDDFVSKNFVQAIKEMEMRTKESSNPIVKILIRIKEFNDNNSFDLGETNLFTSSDTNSKNQKAIDLLKKLIEEIDKTKSKILTLSESFDLEFKIIENDNDSGWVERLSNVGSEGTDILVKTMINILLLNVFKEGASRQFKDFKLHCMMDEIGRLHPTNVKGILRFANERNILLINGSPTSQNATDYKYTFKLSKQQSKTDTKKYVTKINRLVKVTQTA
ncbi:ATP-binding protein [Tenacibaculum maritimum]|uniref:ATP-binding protein n=1 Tax=Tenacibaculum maritimum TaxID=107401 RepID=UPI00388FC972